MGAINCSDVRYQLTILECDLVFIHYYRWIIPCFGNIFALQEVTSEVIFRFRVPLKTALKRENEIGVSDTRKGSESGLAPGEET